MARHYLRKITSHKACRNAPYYWHTTLFRKSMWKWWFDLQNARWPGIKLKIGEGSKLALYGSFNRVIYKKRNFIAEFRTLNAFDSKKSNCPNWPVPATIPALRHISVNIQALGFSRTTILYSYIKSTTSVICFSLSADRRSNGLKSRLRATNSRQLLDFYVIYVIAGCIHFTWCFLAGGAFDRPESGLTSLDWPR